MSKNILCSISTKGRYDTTLPLALMSVANQTLKPNKLVIFDDNDTPVDVREIQHYWYILNILNLNGIEWEWLFAEKKGQHYNHQRANSMGYKWVWRMDDDTVADPNVLETLYSHVNDDVGAVGGSVLTPPIMHNINATGKIQDIDKEPNLQWGMINEKKEVDHLHCSFLYRAGVTDYCLGLSRIAHREETLFTYELKLKGYKNYVVPNAITWHLKNKKGGIRDGAQSMFEHDEQVFRNRLQLEENTIVVLDCGMGDHIVFKHVLPEIKNPVVFSCYPEIVPGKSIAEAHQLFGSIDQYNIYAKMDQWNWKGSLEDAFRKMYVHKHPVVDTVKNISKVAQKKENAVQDLIWLKDKHSEIFGEVIQGNEYELTREEIEGKNVIDIGANVGIFSIFSAYLGAKKVLCVEPASDTYKKLTDNIKISKFKNIKSFNNVVSNIGNKDFNLNILDDSGHNSLYDKSDTYETIKSITLPELLDQVNGDTVLKIDCEGSEYDILMDLDKDALSKVVGIHIEIHADLHPTFKGFEVIENKITSFGFRKVTDKQMYGYMFNEKKEFLENVPLPVKLCYFEKI